MKVLRDGKEVKNAVVAHDISGTPVEVRVNGVVYDAAAFTFEDEKQEKQTKPADTKKTSKVTKQTTTKKQKIKL